MATCQSCFKKIPDNTLHCPHCGAAQQQPDGKKTVFGYAAGNELQQLRAQQPPAPQQPPAQQPASGSQPPGDALAKTMFAPEQETSQPAQGRNVPDGQPHPQQEPASRTGQEPASRTGPNVRMPQIDPSLRTPPTDPIAHITEGHPQQQRPSPAGGHPAAAAAPPPQAPPGATPPGGFPPTMIAPGAQQQMTPPTQQPAPPTVESPAAATQPPAAQAPAARTPGVQTPVVQRSVQEVHSSTGRVSAGLYLAFILGGGVISGVLTGIAAANLSHMHELLYFSWMPSIISAVFFMILLYKAWAALQDGQTPVSPGKALGFLFIPFFNIYWIFVAFGSWGKHYNAYLDRNGINGPKMSEGLFIAYPVCCIVPIANLAAPILAIIVILKWCEGINTIAGARQ
jgi:hypothetical protein